MAVGLYFTPESFSKEQYDATIARLEAAGAGSPDGRLHHFALEFKDGISVFDIWESMEQFEAFGQTLLPILEELGVDTGEPYVQPVHNTIAG